MALRSRWAWTCATPWWPGAWWSAAPSQFETQALISVWPSTAVAPSSAEQQTSNLAVSEKSIFNLLFELSEWVTVAKINNDCHWFSTIVLWLLSTLLLLLLQQSFLHYVLLFFILLHVPADLNDFPPDSRSPQTAYEGIGTFLACQPPPHYPGIHLTPAILRICKILKNQLSENLQLAADRWGKGLKG